MSHKFSCTILARKLVAGSPHLILIKVFIYYSHIKVCIVQYTIPDLKIELKKSMKSAWFVSVNFEKAILIRVSRTEKHILT